jgi:hypothetical protein
MRNASFILWQLKIQKKIIQDILDTTGLELQDRWSYCSNKYQGKNPFENHSDASMDSLMQ